MAARRGWSSGAACSPEPEDTAAGRSRKDAAATLMAASGGALSHTSVVTAVPLVVAAGRRQAQVDPSYGSCTSQLSWPTFTEPWSVPFQPL